MTNQINCPICGNKSQEESTNRDGYVNDATFNEIYNYAKVQNKLCFWYDSWKNEEYI